MHNYIEISSNKMNVKEIKPYQVSVNNKKRKFVSKTSEGFVYQTLRPGSKKTKKQFSLRDVDETVIKTKTDKNHHQLEFHKNDKTSDLESHDELQENVIEFNGGSSSNRDHRDEHFCFDNPNLTNEDLIIRKQQRENELNFRCQSSYKTGRATTRQITSHIPVPRATNESARHNFDTSSSTSKSRSQYRKHDTEGDSSFYDTRTSASRFRTSTPGTDYYSEVHACNKRLEDNMSRRCDSVETRSQSEMTLARDSTQWIQSNQDEGEIIEDDEQPEWSQQRGTPSGYNSEFPPLNIFENNPKPVFEASGCGADWNPYEHNGRNDFPNERHSHRPDYNSGRDDVHYEDSRRYVQKSRPSSSFTFSSDENNNAVHDFKTPSQNSTRRSAVNSNLKNVPIGTCDSAALGQGDDHRRPKLTESNTWDSRPMKKFNFYSRQSEEDNIGERDLYSNNRVITADLLGLQDYNSKTDSSREYNEYGDHTPDEYEFCENIFEETQTPSTDANNNEIDVFGDHDRNLNVMYDKMRKHVDIFRNQERDSNMLSQTNHQRHLKERSHYEYTVGESILSRSHHDDDCDRSSGLYNPSLNVRDHAFNRNYESQQDFHLKNRNQQFEYFEPSVELRDSPIETPYNDQLDNNTGEGYEQNRNEHYLRLLSPDHVATSCNSTRNGFRTSSSERENSRKFSSVQSSGQAFRTSAGSGEFFSTSSAEVCRSNTGSSDFKSSTADFDLSARQFGGAQNNFDSPVGNQFDSPEIALENDPSLSVKQTAGKQTLDLSSSFLYFRKPTFESPIVRRNSAKTKALGGTGSTFEFDFDDVVSSSNRLAKESNPLARQPSPVTPATSSVPFAFLTPTPTKEFISYMSSSTSSKQTRLSSELNRNKQLYKRKASSKSRSATSSSTELNLCSSSSELRTPRTKARTQHTPGSTSSNQTAEQGTLVMAITEGRGQARGEVGIAAIDPKHPNLILCQISDTPTYIHTLTKIHVLNPVQIIMPNTITENSEYNKLFNLIKDKFEHIELTSVLRRYFSDSQGLDYIRKVCLPEHSNVLLLIHHKFYALAASCALIKYVEFVQNIIFLSQSLQVQYQASENVTFIDFETSQKLELVISLSQNDKSKCNLFGVLNHCLTLGGQRRLRSNILQASCNGRVIAQRINCVTELVDNPRLLNEIQTSLKKFSEVERLLSLCYEPTSLNKDSKKHFEAQISLTLLLKSALESLPALVTALSECQQPLFKSFKESFSDSRFKSILSLIEATIRSDAAAVKGFALGQMQRCFAVKENVNSLLDVARTVYSEIVDDIYNKAREMSQELDLPLRVSNSSSRAFHLSFAIRKTFKLKDLPPLFINVTLNKSRTSVAMTTEEIIFMNQRIKAALNEVHSMTNLIIRDLLKKAHEHMSCIYKLCEHVAELDLIVSLAQVSSSNNYVRPTFGSKMVVRDSRHPLLDFISPVEPVANDIVCTRWNNFHIITGPNMSGKSIYIKQVALLQIMAQVGCYVPASSAQFRLVDRIYSRIGFQDSIECNASTFALEMKEIAHICRYVTPRSLILVDELCRGTSIDEGTSLAWSICESLVQTKAFVFFTTHFLQLSQLENLYSNVTNYHLEAKYKDPEHKSGVIYTHKLVPGVTSIEHYGLKLAEKTGLPHSVLEEARELAVRLTRENQTNARGEFTEKINRANEELIHKLLDHYEDGKLDMETARNILEPFQELHIANYDTQDGNDQQIQECMGEDSRHNINRAVNEDPSSRRYDGDDMERQRNTEEYDNFEEYGRNTQTLNDKTQQQNQNMEDDDINEDSNTRRYNSDDMERHQNTQTFNNARYQHENQHNIKDDNINEDTRRYNSEDVEKQRNTEEYDNNMESQQTTEEYEGTVEKIERERRTVNHNRQTRQNMENNRAHDDEIEDRLEENHGQPATQIKTGQFNVAKKSLQYSENMRNGIQTERNAEYYGINERGLRGKIEENSGNQHARQSNTEKFNSHVGKTQQNTEEIINQSQGNTKHDQDNNTSPVLELSEEIYGNKHDSQIHKGNSEKFHDFAQESQKRSEDISFENKENRDTDGVQLNSEESSLDDHERNIQDKDQGHNSGIQSHIEAHSRKYDSFRSDSECDIGKTNDNINENYAHQNGNQYATGRTQRDNVVHEEASLINAMVEKVTHGTDAMDYAYQNGNQYATGPPQTDNIVIEETSLMNDNMEKITGSTDGTTRKNVGFSNESHETRPSFLHESNMNQQNPDDIGVTSNMNEKTEASVKNSSQPTNFSHEDIHVQHAKGFDINSNKLDIRHKTNNCHKKTEQSSSYKNGTGKISDEIEVMEDPTDKVSDRCLPLVKADNETLLAETEATHFNPLDYSKSSHARNTESRSHKPIKGDGLGDSERRHKRIDNFPNELTDSTDKFHSSSSDCNGNFNSNGSINSKYSSSQSCSKENTSAVITSNYQRSYAEKSTINANNKYQSSYSSDSSATSLGQTDGPKMKRTKFMPKHRLVFRK